MAENEPKNPVVPVPQQIKPLGTFRAGAGTKPLDGEQYAAYVGAWVIVVAEAANNAGLAASLYAAASEAMTKRPTVRMQFRMEHWSNTKPISCILNLMRPLGSESEDPPAGELIQSVMIGLCQSLTNAGYELVRS